MQEDVISDPLFAAAWGQLACECSAKEAFRSRGRPAGKLFRIPALFADGPNFLGASVLRRISSSRTSPDEVEKRSMLLRVMNSFAVVRGMSLFAATLFLSLAFLAIGSAALGETLMVEYDAQGRVSIVQYTSQNKKVLYQYDRTGNRTQVSATQVVAPPSCVGGAVVEAVCYRVGTTLQDCNQVCSSHGSCSLAATRRAGSDASSASVCAQARTALLGEYDNGFSHDNMIWPESPLGCAGGYDGNDQYYVWYGRNVPTTCEQVPTRSQRRICGCAGDNPGL